MFCLKKYIIGLVVFILVFISIKSHKGAFALTNFLSLNNTKLNTQNVNDVEQEIGENLYRILSERTRIMQGVTFGSLSIEEGEHQLSNLLEDPLLETDINYLRQVLEYPTDIEEIIAMKLGPVQNLMLSENDSILHFTSEVVWTFKDMDQISEMEICYTFELAETPTGTYKLRNYYLVQ